MKTEKTFSDTQGRRIDIIHEPSHASPFTLEVTDSNTGEVLTLPMGDDYDRVLIIANALLDAFYAGQVAERARHSA
jgi:hypothetical protein